MMLFLIFVMLVAGATAAVPQPQDLKQSSDGKIVSGVISLIKDFDKTIKDNHLDPWVYKGSEHEFEIPDEHLYVLVRTAIGKFVLKGIGNLRSERINYNPLTGRVTIIVYYPSISFTLENTDVLVQIDDKQYDAFFCGSGGFRGLRVHIELQVTLNTVRSVTVVVTYPDIQTDLIVIVGGVDMSKPVNKYLQETVREWLIKHSDDINKALSEQILSIVNARWCI